MIATGLLLLGGIIATIIFIIDAVLARIAVSQLKAQQFRGVVQLATAQRYLNIIFWILLGVIIFVILGTATILILAPEAALFTNLHSLATILFLLGGLLAFGSGILGAIAAGNISSAGFPGTGSPYSYAVWIAVLGIGGTFLLIGIIIALSALFGHKEPDDVTVEPHIEVSGEQK